MELVKVKIVGNKKRYLGYWRVGQGAMYFNTGGEAMVDPVVLKDQPWMVPVKPEPVPEPQVPAKAIERATAPAPGPMNETPTEVPQTKERKTRRKK